MKCEKFVPFLEAVQPLIYYCYVNTVQMSSYLFLCRLLKGKVKIFYYNGLSEITKIQTVLEVGFLVHPVSSYQTYNYHLKSQLQYINIIITYTV